MGCHYCGGGDWWIKTCHAPDGSRLRVCDPCWEIRKSILVIVPGDTVVTARCDGCGVYGNPRDFPRVRPGGRKDTYSGTCGPCTEGDAEGAVKDTSKTETTLEEGRR